MKEYLPTEKCIACRGACCKRIPAPYTPKDIYRIFGSVEKAIKSNKVAIDWWEGEKVLYFIRPKTRVTNKLFDPSWGGSCIHLTLSGCELSRENRPYFCKILEPKEPHCDDHIKRHNSKYVAAYLWKKEGIDFEKFKD